MKKNRIITFTLGFLIIPSILFASPVARYGYYREIIPQTTESEIVFRFPTESFGKINQLLNTVKVTGSDFQSIRYKTEFASLGPVDGTNIQKQAIGTDLREEQVSAIWDGDWTTNVTLPTDPQEGSATLELTFPIQTPISQIEIIPHKEAQIDSWELAASKYKDKFTWKANKKNFTDEKETQGLYTLKSPLEAKKLRITLWGSNIKIKDLEVFQAPILHFKFTPTNKGSHYIFYGSDTQAVLYSSLSPKNLSTLSPTNSELSQEKTNPDLFPDIDDDGIPNQTDNCLFAPNPNQANQDKDASGDVCDNARTKNNLNQMDIDFDGIGDIEDPCLWSNNKLLRVGAIGASPNYCKTTKADTQPQKTITDNSKKKPLMSSNLLLIIGFFGLIIFIRFFTREKQKNH